MRTIILKVTHICNLGCKYCCVGDNNDNEIVSKRTLKNLFSKLANDSSESTIIWHGGEPLSVGIDYYKEVLKLQELYPQHRFHNSIQTNGTLLNDEFLLFFKEHNFSLGFSLDGNKISHDLNRPFKNGKSSFDVTLKWFKRAQELGMNVGAICVINANTARHIEDIYSFARNNQIPFKFNPQYPAGRATINVDLGLDNNHIAETYIKLFDLWYNDDPKSRANIRMFDVFVEGIADISNGGKSWHGYDCSFCNRCQKSFIGMAPNGDLYPCGKFVGEEHYKYGNINEDKDLQTLLNNDIRQVFLERHELGVEGCKDCRYYSLCSSGCPYNAVLYNKDIHSKNPMCSSLMPLFKHIEQRVKERMRFKDIYIIPLENNSNSSLVYSPLRGNCFVADDIAVKQINRYLDSNGENKCLNTTLQDYLDKWEEQIPLPPKNYSIFSPNQVVLLLTQKCNLSCSYCFAKNARAAKTLSKDTIKAVVDFVFSTTPEQYKTFSFLGGGEPTVEWDLLEWSIAYIRHRQPHNNVHISITTNGTLLSESRIALLKKYDVHVGLSFDILESIQNCQRSYSDGKASFDEVDANLQLLKTYDVAVRIRTTITETSVSLMPDMVEFVHKRYPFIKDIQMEPVQDDNINYDSFTSLFIEHFYKAKELGILYGISIYNMLVSSVSTLNYRFCKGEFCVTPDNHIVSCQRVSSESDEHFKLFKYGNIEDSKVRIDKTSLETISSFENYKGAHCADCFAKYHCAGICPSLRASLSQQNLNSYCNYSKRIVLNELLWQINHLK